MSDSFTDQNEILKILMNYYISKIKKIVHSKKSAKNKYKHLILLQIEFKNDILSHIRMPVKHKEIINHQIQSNIEFYAKLVNIKKNPLKNIMESIKNISR